MKKILTISILFILLFASLVFASSHKHKEKYYQNKLCSHLNGKEEVVINKKGIKARIDCLTSTHAIEFDFANKWAESFGQSQLYSILTGRKAGIVLIIENKNDYLHLRKLYLLRNKLDFDIFIIDNINDNY